MSLKSSPPSQSRIVFAPDSYKGTIRAADAAAALADGWLSARPDDDVACVPMADGGEGTLEAFEAAIEGTRRMPVQVEGPTGALEHSHWLLLHEDDSGPETAVVELASTSGIELLPPGEPLQPMQASSFGFGQAIADALNHGVARLVLAIGGSASSDGGAGVLTALGASVTDARGAEVTRGAAGLESAASIDLSKLRALPAGGAVVLTDVSSPLLGHSGAAHVFAPQKGASPEQVERIEAALKKWARLLGAYPGVSGAGAAGGVGFALAAWGAKISRGAESVAALAGLSEAISSADLVVTGEGSFDAQSGAGKAPSLVLVYALESRVPAIVVAGSITEKPDYLVASLSLTDLAGGVEQAMARPAHWLREAGMRMATRYSAGDY